MRRSDRGQVGWDLLVPTPSELVGKAQRKELSDARRRTRDRELRSEMGKERGSDKRSHRLTEEEERRHCRFKPLITLLGGSLSLLCAHLCCRETNCRRRELHPTRTRGQSATCVAQAPSPETPVEA
ncbi:hypothetical protein QTO34_004295 [Cnephaeus nilssonii]|uniref:Uncharacterized protein n=1 Tax=Cnephaeus nilssonii TaxID=3371016 RepID=A0AA40HNX9_CNENI|nr:hypothetical protein QTO34_004295 [Eptesicus nilssonii]